MTKDESKQRQGIQSIEVGARLLRVLAAHGRPMMLRDLAKSAEMPAAKAHRYLVSFIRMGLVEQDNHTGRYDLGSFSLELGLASLARIDAVRLATPILEDLCEQIGETVALGMLANHGATIVRWVEAAGPITVTLRSGSVLPLANSATGRAFLAYCRSPYFKKLAERELRATADLSGTSLTSLIHELRPTIEEIRLHGISRASGSLTPGINGFAAPVFDHTGYMVGTITSLGAFGHFDAEWNSPLAFAIKDAARSLSLRLGHMPLTAAPPESILDTLMR